MKVIASLFLAACFCAIDASGGLAQEKFRVASGGFSTAIHAVAWAAYERKIFQKYGLVGEYLALESGTPAMQALLANELQIVFTTGALAITANLHRHVGAELEIGNSGVLTRFPAYFSQSPPSLEDRTEGRFVEGARRLIRQLLRTSATARTAPWRCARGFSP